MAVSTVLAVVSTSSPARGPRKKWISPAHARARKIISHKTIKYSYCNPIKFEFVPKSLETINYFSRYIAFWEIHNFFFYLRMVKFISIFFCIIYCIYLFTFQPLFCLTKFPSVSSLSDPFPIVKKNCTSWVVYAVSGNVTCLIFISTISSLYLFFSSCRSISKLL